MVDKTGSSAGTKELIVHKRRKRKTTRIGHIFAASGSWFVRYYSGETITRPDGTSRYKQIARKLGSTSELSRSEAVAKADEYLKTVTVSRRGVTYSSVTIGEYYENRILTLWHSKQKNGNCSERPYLKPSTLYGYEKIWRLYLKPDMADVRLSEYTAQDASRFLNALALRVNTHTLAHVRNVANVIFSFAKSQGDVASNPFTDCNIFVRARAPEQYKAFTPEQVMEVFRGLAGQLQAQVAVGLAYFCSLRPGEVRATRWENWDGADHLAITQSCWRTVVTGPKTPESAAVVKVPRPMLQLLAVFHDAEGRPASGWILHGTENRPLNLDMLTRQVIKPILGEKRIAWHPLKYFRNDSASHISDRTGDSLAASAQLRHRTPATTDAYYSKIMDAARVRACEVLESAFSARGLLTESHAQVAA